MNREIILDRLKEIEDNLVILEKLADLDETAFISDPEKYKLAERCFQLAIESMLDVAHYILAQKNLPRAEGGEALNSLGEYGVIPSDFAQEIRPLAGLRNILVHEYLKIDRRKVYGYLKELREIREFSAYVLKFIDKS